jgi:cytochrome c oxidase subunit 2
MSINKLQIPFIKKIKKKMTFFKNALIIKFGVVTTIYSNKLKTYLDVAEPWQYNFQDPATPVMEGIINFHHDLMFFLVIITVFVSWMLCRCIFSFPSEKIKRPAVFTHGTFIETVWTSIPALILSIIAIPSYTLLYSIEDVTVPILTLKVVGNQWYWSHEYTPDMAPDPEILESYMMELNSTPWGEFRLLEVDHRLVVPARTQIRIIVSANDVLHSWTIPSLGVKIDACPGRMNQISIFIKREGTFYGQCSEICGINHGFMPIVVESVDTEEFYDWTLTLTQREMISSLILFHKFNKNNSLKIMKTV